jgi:hypothetical protein
LVPASIVFCCSSTELTKYRKFRHLGFFIIEFYTAMSMYTSKSMVTSTPMSLSI